MKFYDKNLKYELIDTGFYNTGRGKLFYSLPVKKKSFFTVNGKKIKSDGFSIVGIYTMRNKRLIELDNYMSINYQGRKIRQDIKDKYSVFERIYKLINLNTVK